MTDEQHARAEEHPLALPELVTRNGVVLHVALAGAGDEDRIKTFFRQVTPDDLRFRFLAAVKEVADAQIAAMVGGNAVLTFLATTLKHELVAIATLAGSAGDDTAEVALSVAAEWKHLGISWTLLEYVLAYAKAQGFKVVSSLEAGENHEAIQLEREMGFIARLSSAAPVEILASKTLSEI